MVVLWGWGREREDENCSFSGFSFSLCIIFHFDFENQNDRCDKQQNTVEPVYSRHLRLLEICPLLPGVRDREVRFGSLIDVYPTTD